MKFTLSGQFVYHQWWVDISDRTMDYKGYSVYAIPVENGALVSFSKKQKLNTKSQNYENM